MRVWWYYHHPPQPTYIAALAKFLRNMCQFPSKKMEIHGEILYKLAYLSPTAIIKVYGVTQENDTCCWLGILLLLCKAVFLGQNHYDITLIQISDVYIDCPY